MCLLRHVRDLVQTFRIANYSITQCQLRNPLFAKLQLSQRQSCHKKGKFHRVPAFAACDCEELTQLLEPNRWGHGFMLTCQVPTIMRSKVHTSARANQKLITPQTCCDASSLWWWSTCMALAPWSDMPVVLVPDTYSHTYDYVVRFITRELSTRMFTR